MEASPEPDLRIESNPLIIHQGQDETLDGYPPFDEAPGLNALSTAAVNNFDYTKHLYVDKIVVRINKRC